MGIVGFKQQRTRLQMSLIGMDTNGMRWGNRWLITGEVNSKYRSTKIERERERERYWNKEIQRMKMMARDGNSQKEKHRQVREEEDETRRKKKEEKFK